MSQINGHCQNKLKLNLKMIWKLNVCLNYLLELIWTLYSVNFCMLILKDRVRCSASVKLLFLPLLILSMDISFKKMFQPKLLLIYQHNINNVLTTVNQLLFMCEKFTQGSREHHCCECLSPQTSLCPMDLITPQV